MDSSSDEMDFEDENESIVMCDGSQVFTLKSPMHIVCLIFNILLPGWGTMISASVCTHAVRDENRRSCSCGTFADGML